MTDKIIDEKVVESTENTDGKGQSLHEGRSVKGRNAGQGFEYNSDIPVIPNAALFNRNTVRKMRCPLDKVSNDEVEYKNIELISQFISERGKILPRRLTGISAKKQRLLRAAIHRARHLALIPYMAV